MRRERPSPDGPRSGGRIAMGCGKVGALATRGRFIATTLASLVLLSATAHGAKPELRDERRASKGHTPETPPPTGFVASSRCADCHRTITREWRASMLALSALDPIFLARLEAEKARFPRLADALDDTCARCHSVLAARQPGRDARFTQATAADPTLGALARDGVSCTSCHRITNEGLGRDQSFSGRFTVGSPAKVFGPYADPVTEPMRTALGITPVAGDAIGTSRLCGSCHVLELPVLRLHGARDESALARAKKGDVATTYLEWRNSSFQDETAPKGVKRARCQDCHMRDRHDGRVIEQVIAELPGAKPRAPYSKHELLGSSAITLALLRGDPSALPAESGVRTSTSAPYVPWRELLDERIAQTLDFMATTATIAIRGLEQKTHALEVTVEVKNRTGHKLPTGSGTRRVFIELVARDAAGGIVWGSGMTSKDGVLVDLKGRPLESETSTTVWQRHWDVVESDKKVQIYEERVKEGKGPRAELTTSFLARGNVVKDNRLMPEGWRKDGPFAERTAPVGVFEADSPEYFDGRGAHVVRYRVPAAVARRVHTISATLYHQSLPPWVLAELARTSDGPATKRLLALVASTNLEGTALAGWKIALARAQTTAISLRR
ncbi:cytochrome c family protein [Myxococcota bacterium]|nr:cytochrome c family protein [Myxococcota bacterium]